MTDSLGLDRNYVTSLQGLLPATRFAVEAYVRFVRESYVLMMHEVMEAMAERPDA